MERLDVTPRPRWREDCEAIGFTFHSMDGVYWDESHCYRFTADEIDVLEAATKELHTLSLRAVEAVIAENRLAELAIPPAFADYIKASWNAREPTLLGRFDLAFDGVNPPKLLEYNADTPTALLEASVAQWQWLQDTVRTRTPAADQFNSLHEKLIAAWRVIGLTVSGETPIHFTCVKDSEEDFGTIGYQRDVATQAGLQTRFVYIEDIGWADQLHCFVDGDGHAITVLCKLYPWEWMLRDEFGPHLLETRLRALEPAWKLLLSTKGLLPVLWEMNPDHPNLLPAAFERFRISGDYVQKPMYSREGANVTLYHGGEVLRADGSYGEEGWIYQAYTPIPSFGAAYATVGSWIVGDEPAGIGVREDATPITRNTSHFVPHYFI
ncbi:MAG TPA: glutathionylspermidine synthase family protein [Casimicrobiaceae bacterium]|jgi:glutathionylspermidine synthase|nr:glutathionylspermidine synthase family protein [Casimicrobiaceae bacterium]